MLKGKGSALPLHHGVAPSASSSAMLSQALEKTISLVGLSSTKTGSGDKERAYVVKQNSLLKAVLTCFVLALVVLLAACSTVLELRVVRRDWVRSEAVHHKREHLDHEDFLHSALELQEELEFSLEETHNLEEFRAFFQREHGQCETHILDDVLGGGDSQPDDKNKKQVRHALREFSNKIQSRLARMINRFQAHTGNSTDRVRVLAKRMGKEIELDKRLQLNFQERLKEWGVDEAYAEAAVDQYEEDYAAEEHVNEEPGEVVRRRREQEKHSETEIAQHVDRFFHRLRELDLPEIPESVVKELDIQLNNFLDQLPDETKEADLAGFQKQMDALLEPFFPAVERFDAEKHDSLLDHYGAIVEKSRLARHKKVLLEMYSQWKQHEEQGGQSGERVPSAMDLLAVVEQLAEREEMVKMFDLMDDRDMDPGTEHLKLVEVEEEFFDTTVDGEAPKLVKRTAKRLVVTGKEEEEQEGGGEEVAEEEETVAPTTTTTVAA